MFCSNPHCDYEFEDSLTTAQCGPCPKCGGLIFKNPKNWAFNVPMTGYVWNPDLSQLVYMGEFRMQHSSH